MLLSFYFKDSIKMRILAQHYRKHVVNQKFFVNKYKNTKNKNLKKKVDMKLILTFMGKN